MTDAEATRLASQIQRMSSRTRLYKLLKQELSALGYWKNKPRGKHDKGKMNGRAIL